MVDVVPTARQELIVAHAAPCSRPVPVGTVAAVHVAPPSVLMAMAPCPWPAVVAVKPVTRQAAPAAQERSPASMSPGGRSPSRAHVCPKSVEWADQKVVPSLAMTVQSSALAHSTLVTTMAPAGTAAWAQVVPPSPVVSTTPAVPVPLRPTAMQSRALGHEIPVRAGAGVSVTGCAVQVSPPSTVASITVAGDGGAEEVVLVAPVRPGGADGPTVRGSGAGHGVELAGPGRGGLAHDRRGPRLLAEDAGLAGGLRASAPSCRRPRSAPV